MKLPPLPELWRPFYGADMEAYGLACAEAMREECAKLADHEEEGGRNECDIQWAHCAEWLASAIRSIEVER